LAIKLACGLSDSDVTACWYFNWHAPDGTGGAAGSEVGQLTLLSAAQKTKILQRD
jgi:hypothetical protein